MWIWPAVGAGKRAWTRDEPADDESPASVVLKASDDQPMVMCTPTRTFELRKVETSNSVFLAPADLRETPAQPVGIVASASCHFEVCEATAPLLSCRNSIINPVSCRRSRPERGQSS